MQNKEATELPRVPAQGRQLSSYSRRSGVPDGSKSGSGGVPVRARHRKAHGVSPGANEPLGRRACVCRPLASHEFRCEESASVGSWRVPLIAVRNITARRRID